MYWLKKIIYSALQLFGYKSKVAKAIKLYKKKPIIQTKNPESISDIQPLSHASIKQNFLISTKTDIPKTHTLNSDNYKTKIENDKPVFQLAKNLEKNIFELNRYTNYKPIKKYEQETPEYFPLVLFPEHNCLIKPPVNGKNCNAGITEFSFCKDFLLKYFNNYVYDNLSVFLGSSCFEPDIAYINMLSGDNICIDIEIDEPYDGVTRKPTHFRKGDTTSDQFRNENFIARGWIVIRFAEQQIISNPKGCCKFIYEILQSLDTNLPACDFNETTDLVNFPIWSAAEASAMAQQNERESYLGITKFNVAANPRNYLITDSEMGIEIENLLKNKMSTLPNNIFSPQEVHLKPQTFILNKNTQKELVNPIVLEEKIIQKTPMDGKDFVNFGELKVAATTAQKTAAEKALNEAIAAQTIQAEITALEAMPVSDLFDTPKAAVKPLSQLDFVTTVGKPIECKTTVPFNIASSYADGTEVEAAIIGFAHKPWRNQQGMNTFLKLRVGDNIATASLQMVEGYNGAMPLIGDAMKAKKETRTWAKADGTIGKVETFAVVLR